MTKNLAASVRQRLTNKAREQRIPFGEISQRYAIERLLYRLAQSPHAEAFILKGALMFTAWRGPTTRPTMDIDLLGRVDNQLDTIRDMIREACTTVVVADGLTFDPESVVAGEITEEADYRGVRVKLSGRLGNMRLRIQIDIGFGDVVIPAPSPVTLPAILDFPAPKLQGYSRESLIAEKYQAMVKLGDINSRMKDFYDIWLLARTTELQAEILVEAIHRTFANRRTERTPNPAVFRPGFATDQKQRQWRAFLKKSKLDDAPSEFATVVQDLQNFLAPLLSDANPPPRTWTWPSGWSR